MNRAKFTAPMAVACALGIVVLVGQAAGFDFFNGPANQLVKGFDRAEFVNGDWDIDIGSRKVEYECENDEGCVLVLYPKTCCNKGFRGCPSLLCEVQVVVNATAVNGASWLNDTNDTVGRTEVYVCEDGAEVIAIQGNLMIPEDCVREDLLERL